jgi:hypothetical protein
MQRTILALAAVFGLAIAHATRAEAQYPPMGGIMELAQQNFALGVQADAMVWPQAVAIARSLPPGTRLTIDPHFADGYGAASDVYIKGMQANSKATSAAINRWDYGAIRGEWGYRAGNGAPTYILPSNQNGYTISPWNRIQPGYHPNGTYLYPTNNW